MTVRVHVLEVSGADAWVELAYKRNWTDGFPAMPPTVEQVEAFINSP